MRLQRWYSRPPELERLTRLGVFIALVIVPRASDAAKFSGGYPGGFLEYGSGARAMGMGRAYGAVADGPESLIWNPAGLGLPYRTAASFTHVALFGGATMSELSVARAFRRPFGVGASIVSFGNSGFQQRDANNNETGSFSDSRRAFLLGWGVQPSSMFSVGLTHKLIRTELGDSASNGVDTDIGVMGKMGRYRAGVQVQNIMGASLSRDGGQDVLTRNIRLGGAVQVISPILATLDIVSKPGATDFRLGMEYVPLNWTALRIGWDGTGPTAGASLSLKSAGIDFAVGQHPVLGLTQRITLRYGWGASSDELLHARARWRDDFIAGIKEKREKQREKALEDQRVREKQGEDARRLAEYLDNGETALGQRQFKRAYAYADFALQLAPDSLRAKAIINRAAAEGFKAGISVSGRPPRLAVKELAFEGPLNKKALVGGDSGKIALRVANQESAGPALDLRAYVAASPSAGLRFAKEFEMGDVWSGKDALLEFPIEGDFNLKDGTATITIRFSEASRNPPGDAVIEVRTEKLQPPQFRIAKIRIDDGMSIGNPDRVALGNNNAILDRGETVELFVTVLNEGLGEARGVSLTLDGQDSADVSIVDHDGFRTRVDISKTIPSGGWVEVPFAVTVTKLYRGPDLLEFPLEISESRKQFSQSLSIKLPVGKPDPTGKLVRAEAMGTPVLQQTPLPSFGDELWTLPKYHTSRKDAYAVVIGIENYRDLLRSSYAERDAALVSKYVRHALGVPEDHIKTILNDRAGLADFRESLEVWLKNRVTEQSEVFVFFAGHGTPDLTDRQSFLVPYDASPSSLRETGYPLKKLYEVLDGLPARRVLVMLDACFSGAGGPRTTLAKGIRPIVPVVEEIVLASGKMVVLSAASGSQITGIFEEKQQGLFTYFLVRGLQGEADENKDSVVTLAELFSYLKPRVTARARLDNREQVPNLLPSADNLGAWANAPLIELSSGR